MAAIGLVGGAGMAFEPPLPAAVGSKGERTINEVQCFVMIIHPYLFFLFVLHPFFKFLVNNGLPRDTFLKSKGL